MRYKLARSAKDAAFHDPTQISRRRAGFLDRRSHKTPSTNPRLKQLILEADAEEETR